MQKTRRYPQSLKTFVSVIAANPAKSYLILGLLFGLLFVIITPPFYNADEPNHFYRAYQLSHGDVLADKTANGVGGLVPNSAIITTGRVDINQVFTGQNLHEKLFGSSAIWHIPLNKAAQTPVVFANTALYSPVVYAPQIATIEVLKVFNAPIVAMVYAGRLAGLLVATALMFLAIRCIPFGKWAVVAIGLLPMTVACFASFSGDGITIGSCTLLVAYALYVASRNLTLQRKQIITLALLVAVVALSKSTYALFILILGLLPLLNAKLRTRRNYVIVGGVVAFGLLLAVLWQHGTNYIKVINPDPTVNVAAQTHNIVSRPLHFVAITLPNTLLTNNHDGVIESMFGYFASLSTPLPYLFVLLSSFALLFSMLAATAEENITKLRLVRMSGRLLALLIGIGTILATTLALYLYWTPVGLSQVQGIQGRYFIPVLVLGILAFPTAKIVVQPKFRNYLILSLSTLSLVAAACVCLAKFYDFSSLL